MPLLLPGGPENNALIWDQYLNKPEINIKKLTAQCDILQSNSMVEAVNKHVKYWYLFTKPLKGFEEVHRFLEYAVPDYNNKPHGSLFGFTPNEVCDGQIPVKDLLKDKMIAARAVRVAENRKSNCESC